MTEFDRFLSLLVTKEDFCGGKHVNDFGCTTIPLTQCEVPPPLSDSSSLSMLSNANTVERRDARFLEVEHHHCEHLLLCQYIALCQFLPEQYKNIHGRVDI